MSTEEDLANVLSRLQARRDNSYIQYISRCRMTECIGWQIKVEKGEFGQPELTAHTKAAEELGRHRALNEAIDLILEEMKT